MDIEWAKDREKRELFIVQAHPNALGLRMHKPTCQRTWMARKGRKLTLLSLSKEPSFQGLSASSAIPRISTASCQARCWWQTTTTNPDWVSIMRQAAAIITDRGGRTSHAAIVSRELGVPAMVGAGDATKVLHQKRYAAVACAEGDEGFVYEGIPVVIEEMDVTAIPGAHEDHAEHGQSCSCISLVAAASKRVGLTRWSS